MKDINEKVLKVQKLMDENGINAMVYQYRDDMPVVCAEIIWGDWKHEHLRADWLVEEKLNGCRIKSVITEEDGSDCYCAVHYYMV